MNRIAWMMVYPSDPVHPVQTRSMTGSDPECVRHALLHPNLLGLVRAPVVVMQAPGRPNLRR
jgi:hypothetical protein